MLLLLFLIAIASADVKDVLLVESFDLKTTEKSDITCSSIQKIFVESVPVIDWHCMGETVASTKGTGMMIFVQMNPVTPNDNKLAWQIEYTNGNITSSFDVSKTMEQPLQFITTVQITRKSKAHAIFTNRVQILANEQENKSTSPATSHITEAPKNTATPSESTKPEAAVTSTVTHTIAPTNKVSVAINYMQFYSGQAPVYVNKHSQAVVVAVIEGLILGAILAIAILRCYRKSKLDAAGVHPSSNDYQSNNMRNTVYYDNGSSLNYITNSRPEIPSYRTADVQAPMRLDSLSSRQQQPAASPTLMPISVTLPATTARPAPLNNWPEQQSRAQPIRNIMDSDI